MINKKTISKQWRKHGKEKQKKQKVYHIGAQRSVRLPETWHTQICWRTFVRGLRCLSQPER